MACLSWKTAVYNSLGLLCLCFYVLSPSITLGQILPEITLPNNTVAMSNGDISTIWQGTQVGNNLFHSFLAFSVPVGNVAFLALPH
jgi:large exoprotein involved in heme utilization and adhesion